MSKRPQLTVTRGTPQIVVQACQALNDQLSVRSPNPNGVVTNRGRVEVARLDETIVLVIKNGGTFIDQVAKMWREQLGFIVVHWVDDTLVLGMRPQR